LNSMIAFLVTDNLALPKPLTGKSSRAMISLYLIQTAKIITSVVLFNVIVFDEIILLI
jgi:hypothetical protein